MILGIWISGSKNWPKWDSLLGRVLTQVYTNQNVCYFALQWLQNRCGQENQRLELDPAHKCEGLGHLKISEMMSSEIESCILHLKKPGLVYSVLNFLKMGGAP